MPETKSLKLQKSRLSRDMLFAAKGAVMGALMGACASAPALLVTMQLTKLNLSQLGGILLIGTAIGGLCGVGWSWVKNWRNARLEAQSVVEKSAPIDGFANNSANQALMPQSELILCLSKNGDVVDHSGTAHEQLNDLAGYLFGTGLLDRILISDKPAFLKSISDAANGLTPKPVRLSVAVSRGPLRYCSYEFIALPTPHGCRGVLRDIDRELALEEAESARKGADSGSGDIIRIAAHLAHELRTPLNAILGYSEMLGTNGLANIKEDQRKGYADIVHQSGTHLLNVVDNMLSVGQLKAKRYDIAPQTFDLVELCGDCVTVMSQQAKDANVELIFDVSTVLEPVFADMRCCRQMLLNLIGNAIKFNNAGGTATILLGKKLGHIFIQVEDTGIGIPDEAMARLGQPFERVDGTHIGGTGLGLVLVREMAELHGGHLRLDSILGEGTIATIELPHLRAALEPQSTGTRNGTGNGNRVHQELKRRHG